jgi:hypothetical protein
VHPPLDSLLIILSLSLSFSLVGKTFRSLTSYTSTVIPYFDATRQNQFCAPTIDLLSLEGQDDKSLSILNFVTSVRFALLSLVC